MQTGFEGNNFRLLINDDGKSLDTVLQESGNSYISVRKGYWYDQKDLKLDIRKYTTNQDGTERMGSGVCLNDEGTTELVSVLVNEGYGDTKDIINGIKDRQDFVPSLKKCLSPSVKEELDEELDLGLTEVDDDEEDDYYDIREDMLE